MSVTWAAVVLGSGCLLGSTWLGSNEPALAVPAHVGTHQPIRYGRDIRPILSDRCFQCHGPDSGTLEAGLRLDDRDSATAARTDGRPAIVPGDASQSELLHRIASSDPNVQMPPPSSHKSLLTPSQQQLIARWIDEGAAYEDHWSFTAPQRPTVPATTGWSRNAIDAFTLAAMHSAGLGPSPEAPRATLLRRVFLDLTGLPPTPEELDAFLRDERPDAYERWVERLLTEEPYRTRYAEHMASPWLDQARYADTIGIHTDAGKQMWLWRDWVIEAYRANMPFDQFVIEQLAGDLLPDATTQQIVATGFNRNHVITDEGGAIDEEYLVEYAVDRTSTVGSVMFGLTFGCARCHDHKFDPISAHDFYSVYAFFNSNDEPGLYSQIADANRAFEPFIEVPTTEQSRRLAEIDQRIAELRASLDVRSPEERALKANFAANTQAASGIAWIPTRLSSVVSTAGATLESLDDGSIRAGGTNADVDDYVVTLQTAQAESAPPLRLLALEVLEEPSAFEGRLGRAPNGNAVVTGLDLSLVSASTGEIIRSIPLVWAWADWSQTNGDFAVTNLLDPASRDGWALDAHQRPGSRIALVLAEDAFELSADVAARMTIRQQSIYANHTIARFRLSLASINDEALASLPIATSRGYVSGPFEGDAAGDVWEPQHGPESASRIDLSSTFGPQNAPWRFDERAIEGRVIPLADGRNISYVGFRVFSPSPRSVPVSLGSDDGFRLFVNGAEVASRRIERGAAPDQDTAVLPLASGENALVMKIVNTGGQGAAYMRSTETAPLGGDLVWAILPEARVGSELAARLERAWSEVHLPRYRETAAEIDRLEAEVQSIRAAVPRTMVMKELQTPRETFVLTAGLYDKPDRSKPVERAVPAALGVLPSEAPRNRLGLAQWMVSAENPLLARVTVNRFWQQFFGVGIVETSEDFGLQGAWPSHPELLDWLAVEFRENAWDVQHIVRLIVTSATYRQSSDVKTEARSVDPGNRLLSWFPRRRLSAEALRDQALHVSGLLVEKVGGPPVKPYQPAGLWEEVAMPQSNTRTYQQGSGDDLWRRSLYTYWKRAVPPPSMATFDAPTRESCVTQRLATSTPLQALVLINDEQYREAARVLAARTLNEADDDDARLRRLFVRCVAREPEPHEIEIVKSALAEFRDRFAADESAASGLIRAGESPVPEGLNHTELAAWTMIASSMLNLYETTTQE